MEGHGTNMDQWLKLEGEVASLRKDIGDVRADNADTRAQMAALARGQDTLQHTLADVATKLDETRTRRPNLLAVATVGVGVFGIISSYLAFGFVLMSSWLDPVRSEQTIIRTQVESLQEKSWTEADAQRAHEQRMRETDVVWDAVRQLQDRQWRGHAEE